MSRSIWKGVYLGCKEYINKDATIFNRRLEILRLHVGKTVYIYNGMKKVKLTIDEAMCQHIIGEFAYTRKIGKKIHNVDKRKKSKNKK